MSAAFVILAMLTLLCAVAAVSLRNLVHCALALTLAFAGLAALYLQLNAQFVGFAQVLVYIGAVAILIVFAILLTRGAEPAGVPFVSKSWYVGGGVALCVFVVLCRVIVSSKALAGNVTPVATATVSQIGEQLMTRYVLPLEVLGLLLTAALIGAVIIAMREAPDRVNPLSRIDLAQTQGGNGSDASPDPAWRPGKLHEIPSRPHGVDSPSVDSGVQEANR